MGAFDDVHLEWKGKKLLLRSDRVLGGLARVESVITLPELSLYVSRGTAPPAKLSMAYGALLRYVGQDVTDDEVYLEMFGPETPANDMVMTAISMLFSMMIPKGAKTPAGSAPPGNGKPAAKGSSKGPTKSRSATEK